MSYHPPPDPNQPDPNQPVTSQPVPQAPNYEGQAPGEGPGPVQVRPMVTDDADFVGRMTMEAFEGKMLWAVGKNNMPKLIRGSQDSARLMEPEYYRIFVATYNGERAGMVEIQYHGSKSAPGADDAYLQHLSCWPICRLGCMECLLNNNCKKGECYIDHICCDNNFRGKGVGKVLMERAEWEARKRGCTRMTLAVVQSNRARHLYERQGYVISKDVDGCCCTYCATGERKFYNMEKRLM